MFSTEEIEEFRVEALEDLTEVGSDIVVQKNNGTTYDIDLGETVTEYLPKPAKADIVSYLSEEIEGLIQVGDLKLMIPNNLILTIEEIDKIDIEDVSYNIEQVMPEIKKNIIVYYMVRVRR